MQMVEEIIPDLTAYKNLWLSITCFGVKSNIQGIIDDQTDNQESIDGEDKAPEYRARGLIKILAKDLIKVFNGNKRWKATDMDIAEASNISIAIASLRLEG